MGYDAVRKPSHYVEGRKFEPKDVIRDWGLNFNLGNAVKYLARAGRKGDIVEDLRKAQEYIQFELDALKKDALDALNKADAEDAMRYGAIHAKEEKKEKGKPKMDDVKAQCGVIELVVPKDMPMEEVIQMAIAKIMGVEE